MPETVQQIENSSVIKKKKKAGKLRYNWKSGYGMLIPSFILLITFMYYPAIIAIGFSFTNWDGFNQPQFTGLQNYISLFKDKIFLTSMKNVGVLQALIKKNLQIKTKRK